MVIWAVRFMVCAMVVVVALGLGAQITDSRPAAPPIILQLPEGIPSESVWIRYVVHGPGGGAITSIQPRRDVHQYMLYTTLRGGPARSARIVVYAPSCQFQTFDVDLSGTADVAERYTCIPLATKIVRGFLPAAEIPRPYYPQHRIIEITADLNEPWICPYLMTQTFGTRTMTAGSCLVSQVPLGKVGELDPRDGGAFQVSVPDLARDPVYAAESEAWGAGNLGNMFLALREEKIGRSMAAIRPEDSASHPGLQVQRDYPFMVRFAPAH